MLSAIMLITAIWLVVAPAVMGFSSAPLVGSVLSGVITALIVLMRRWGDDRFFWVALGGVYNAVVGFAFAGPARWSAVLAGLALAVAGMMALKRDGGASPASKPA